MKLPEGWHRIELGWYGHKNGAIVQLWRRAWLAWRPHVGINDYTTHKTCAEAMQVATKEGL